MTSLFWAVDLDNAENKSRGRYGIATACVGVGQGIATLFEREA